jgi:alkaline phosphatase D
MHDDGDTTRRGLDRREFLAATGAGILAIATARFAQPAAATTVGAAAEPAGTPFTLGVASGDPRPDAVVLWTRLAPDPAAPDGGMPDRSVTVRWEVATDQDMRKVVRSGRATARPSSVHTVHVDVEGLEPGRDYWYRFRALGEATEPARTRTAPARDRLARRMLVAQASCQHINQGYYTAYDDMAQHDVDLVVHLGDYIYESSSGPVPAGRLPDPLTLDDYRLRYALYKQQPALQAVHTRAPWVVTWDDHEVENNYTSDLAEPGSATPDRASFLRRRAAAYRAWWEHQPVRLDRPSGSDLRVYRRLQFGRLMDLHMLDTRQYRSEQCGDGTDIGPVCEAGTTTATVLGRRQERWLGRGLRASRARWNVIGNQIVLQQWRFAPGNAVWNLDQWDGYPAARARAMEQLARAGGNPVVLTGDVHSSWVGTLARDLDDASSPVLGSEFVGPAIASLPSPLLANAISTIESNSPHLRWAEGTKRGWVRHEVTPDEWTAEYRLVDDGLVPGSAVQTAATFTVDAGGQLQGSPS